MKTVGKRIKFARLKSDLTQVEAAEALRKKGYDITQPHLSKLENDERSLGIDTMKGMAELYGVHILTLFYSEDELKELRKIVKDGDL